LNPHFGELVVLKVLDRFWGIIGIVLRVDGISLSALLWWWWWWWRLLRRWRRPLRVGALTKLTLEMTRSGAERFW
jgi:hypothetical protein